MAGPVQGGNPLSSWGAVGRPAGLDWSHLGQQVDQSRLVDQSG